ncbi:alpha/beta-hydrolase [Eremomyces bilateralis CBS 781.70]|uniref:Alpha/beta-hydrolase n=1 Tax=Eremomyces bilateralis CBS 781.70 TaxID=1392243 RepID=A0A6G1GGD1_9PEZI|nr:alpha/beta-hydrolase [Eremomyces bilateralis CBS 781.70]KAF1817052.1 alpha/beta-hydrolase [Eremomyces bilateralis CBS 781.70]
MAEQTDRTSPYKRVGRAGKLSLLGKIKYYLKCAVIVPIPLLFNIIRATTVAANRRLTVSSFAAAGFLRTLLEQLSPEEIQYYNPNACDTYHAWLEEKSKDPQVKKFPGLQEKLSVDIETLPNGKSSIFWVGDRRTCKKVVLFFHGGGYVFPLLPGHLEWALRYVEETLNTKNEFAVAVLQYTLVPSARYPSQFAEAVDGLQHLFDSGFEPKNIIIGGDSVGGQMAHALLAHVVRPHPAVRKIELAHPLAGAFLVSPFVSLNTQTASYRSNAPIDMLSAPIIRDTARSFFHGTNGHEEIKEGLGWSFPMDVPETWVDSMGAATGKIYITAGKHEIFATSCEEYAERVRGRNTGSVDVTLEIGEKEAHDFILLEGLLKQKGDATERMLKWAIEAISED